MAATGGETALSAGSGDVGGGMVDEEVLNRSLSGVLKRRGSPSPLCSNPRYRLRWVYRRRIICSLIDTPSSTACDSTYLLYEKRTYLSFVWVTGANT